MSEPTNWWVEGNDDIHIFRGACDIYFVEGGIFETSPYGVVTVTPAGAFLSDNASPKSFIPAHRFRLIEAKNQ